MSTELLKKISEILNYEVVEIQDTDAELVDNSSRYFGDYCIESLSDGETFYITEKEDDAWYAVGYVKIVY